MKENFKIKRILDKQGEDNKLIFSFQIIGVFITTCVLVFLLPFFLVFFLGKKSKYLAESSILSNILEIWFNPFFIYPLMFTISTILTFYYFKKELKYTRIIEMIFFDNEVKFIVTNRLGIKYKHFSIPKTELNFIILNESIHEIIGIQITNKNKIIGKFNFLDLSRRSKNEKELLDFISDYIKK